MHAYEYYLGLLIWISVLLYFVNKVHASRPKSVWLMTTALSSWQHFIARGDTAVRAGVVYQLHTTSTQTGAQQRTKRSVLELRRGRHCPTHRSLANIITSTQIITAVYPPPWQYAISSPSTLFLSSSPISSNLSSFSPFSIISSIHLHSLFILQSFLSLYISSFSL